MKEAIINHIQGSSNKENDVKEALEELNIYYFSVIKPKIPVTITVKGSLEEIILREEVKNWFVKKTKYDNNMHKAYALVLGQLTRGLKNELQTRKNIG